MNKKELESIKTIRKWWNDNISSEDMRVMSSIEVAYPLLVVPPEAFSKIEKLVNKKVDK